MPGTLIDSSFISSAGLSNYSWYKDTLSTPLVISAGGVHVAWRTTSNRLTLGRTFQTNASNQSYEILGGNWAPYRSATSEDFYIGIDIEPVIVGEEEYDLENSPLLAYPNPSSQLIKVQLKQAQNVDFLGLMDIKGKHIPGHVDIQGDWIYIRKDELPAGTYFLQINRQLTTLIFTD